MCVEDSLEALVRDDTGRDLSRSQIGRFEEDYEAGFLALGGENRGQVLRHRTETLTQFHSEWREG